MSAEPVLRRLSIASSGSTGTIRLDGEDVSRSVAGYSVSQEAGDAAQAVLLLSKAVAPSFEGLAHVVVGEPPDPGPAAAEFLSALDPAVIEREVLARHDLLDGQVHEFTRATLRLLIEWARGGWSIKEPADAVTPEPSPQRAP
ncbi:hypothetical protein [Streptomyces sp. NPDC088925]|uniref:hypothetical protein n=1 Tax=Streptomyces sp. NPDC088925 TaxID=3365914 RepID=UPI0037F6E281